MDAQAPQLNYTAVPLAAFLRSAPEVAKRLHLFQGTHSPLKHSSQQPATHKGVPLLIDSALSCTLLCSVVCPAPCTAPCT